MKFVKIISWFLATIIGLSLAQSCQTPNKSPGNCVPITECDHLSNIFNKDISTITPSERELLRKSQCGFQGRQPKVCCASASQNVDRTGYSEPQYTVSDLPVPGICGTQSLKDRVLNGENTTISDYPWMALLEYNKGSTSGFYCGGTIIDQNYILTAAHCIKGTVIVRDRYHLVSVRLGEHNLLTDMDCDQDECAPPVINIPVAETIVHENYNAAGNDDDIALIRVAHPITFTDWVKPICLPVADKLRRKDLAGVDLDVVGFGKTESRSKSDVKLHLRMTGTSLQICNDAYRKFRGHNVIITPKQICAGGENGKDSCTGDSGGPLLGEDILDGFSPYNYLAGIVSFGPIPCGKEGVPGVYVKVAEYIDWITGHMRR